MQLCCSDGRRDKNRQCGPCCRRPGTDTPSGHLLSRWFHPCATGKDRKDYASTSAVVFHFRRVTLNPAVNRGVIDIHSTFSQHLLQLTVTYAVFAVPAYRPQNDVMLKMPTFEWVHSLLHQQKGMISLSPPTICNSAAFFTLTSQLSRHH